MLSHVKCDRRMGNSRIQRWLHTNDDNGDSYKSKVVVSIIRGLARALVACSSFKWAFINCKLGRMMIINWTFFRVGVQQRRSLYFKFFPVPKAWTWWFWSLPPRSLNAMISRPKNLENIWMTLLIYFLTLYYVKQDLWKKEKISGTLHWMIIGARVIEGQSIHRLPPRLPPKLISTIFVVILCIILFWSIRHSQRTWI